ncbi:hypothetical protein QQS21_005158 [Conoideocrella luteorostrata]|uniref:Glutamyl-tRNA amidotransferase complex subunit Gta3 domain-containing protein n=1 Tax=Conoideocrella luteorostrata TaxID=1105319 RepID=A0AAJ0CQ65_9HYPO|nr:hypothetical protein QQS21_005158 [Conoideocrella luteorostrata]
MSLRPSCCHQLRRTNILHCLPQTARLSTQRTIPTPDEILAKPSWSMRSLHAPPTSETTEPITTKQIHHLLRLAALPLPRTPAEETSLINTLQSQLRFVRTIQRVDTRGVEPLRAIRDETAEGVRENTVTLADMRALLDQEQLVGHYKRPRRVKSKIDEDAEKWDVLGTASRRAGKYFVVDSSKKGLE